VVEVTGTRLAYEARAADGSAALLVALNLDDGPWSFTPPAGARLVASQGGPAADGVAGRGWAVWEL